MLSIRSKAFRGRRVVVIFTTAGLALGGVVAVRNDAPAGASPNAAEAVAAFAQPASDATRVSETLANDFAAAFSRHPSHAASLDLGRLRRFDLGDETNFAVTAAPTRSGGICYLDSLSGGTCLDTFTRGAGMIMSIGPVMSLDHYAITGMAPDRVTKITFQTSGKIGYSASVHNNVYRLDLPADVAAAQILRYTFTYSDGAESSDEITPPAPSTNPPLGQAPS